MVNVNFSGNVNLQAAAGETVTITITYPDGKTTDTQTAQTLADGTYATAAKPYDIAGTYTWVANLPADSKYKAQSVSDSFPVTLADRVLTVNVNLS